MNTCVAPGHCTGEPTFAALKKAFGDRYLYAGSGASIALGPTPRALLDRAAMDEGDLASYRALLSRSDDDERTLLAADID